MDQKEENFKQDAGALGVDLFVCLQSCPCFSCSTCPEARFVQTRHRQDSPVLDGVEGLLIRDVIHQDETHGPPVVGGGDGSVSLLPRRVLWGERRKNLKMGSSGARP